MGNCAYFVVGILALIVCLLFFFLRGRGKNREEQKKQRIEEEKRLNELKGKYLGRKLFLVWVGGQLLDETFNLIEDFENSYLGGRIHKDSHLSTVIPIEITSIRKPYYSEGLDWDVEYVVRPDVFEFEIFYVGVTDAIAKSPILGELYLPKRKFLQYEVGKKLKIRFCSRKAGDVNLNVITPEIIKSKNEV